MKFNEVKMVVLIILAMPFFIIDVVMGTDQIFIIGNKSIVVNSLDHKTISEIFKAEKSKWHNNEKITVVMLKKGPIHETFVKNHVGITPKKLIRIWRKVIFTGMGNPPIICTSEADMIQTVAETKGAIGYIGTDTSNKNVKLISIMKK